jgi:ribosomal protein S18 acetylase RimI-like enzyme
MRIRTPSIEEIGFLTDLGNRTGIFKDGEAEELLGTTLQSLFKGSLSETHKVYVLEQDSSIKGWVYFGCDNFEQDRDIWDLWWIGVDPQFQGQGYGKRLLTFVEDIVMEKSANADKAVLLRIETSSAEDFNKTRDFYRLMGYKEERIVANAYGPGEDKVVLTKGFH